MPELSAQDEQSVDRLSFYMLKEAYSAVASLLRKVDPDTAQCMFVAIEKQIEAALRSIHVQQSEGPASSAIATAIAETLVPVLDGPHRTQHRAAPAERRESRDNGVAGRALVFELRRRVA